MPEAAQLGAASTPRMIPLPGVDPSRFFGPGDELLRELEQQFAAVDLHLRCDQLQASGNDADCALLGEVIQQLCALARSGVQPTRNDVVQCRSIAQTEGAPAAASVLGESILTVRGGSIRAKTIGQKRYLDAIEDHTIVFGIGPAGTGKTYLAMAKAVQLLQRREVSKIILTRPAVEAGERLGFLPGSLEDKIDPYLRPLFDALSELMEAEALPRLIASGAVEVAPLAYMRGRTLNDACIILDEAQNTTPEQMKMFLTRLGFGSRMIVTGDITQVDVPVAASGLRLVTTVLDGVDDIHFARLGSDDVVRHSLVGRIIDAYSSYDEQQQARRARAEQEPTQA